MKTNDGGAAAAKGKRSAAAFRRRAEEYLEACCAEGRNVTIGGFCRAMDITLETLRAWSETRRKARERRRTEQTAESRGTESCEQDAVFAVIDRFWTRYFECAEAALDEKDTANAAKFKLERLMPYFEADDGAEEEDGNITVTFSKGVEPYSR